MSWVGVPPEAADFSQEKSLPQVSLNCVVLCCYAYLESVSELFIMYMHIHILTKAAQLTGPNHTPY